MTVPFGSPHNVERAVHAEAPQRPPTTSEAAQLAGNDPRKKSEREAELRRIYLILAARKVANAEKRVRADLSRLDSLYRSNSDAKIVMQSEEEVRESKSELEKARDEEKKLLESHPSV